MVCVPSRLDDDVWRDELRQFLKYARSRLCPADVGLVASGRRRVTGLRRDEVAALCDVSVAWYTWFETGKIRSRASARFIAAVGRALRLDVHETRYLFSLAIPEIPKMCPPAPELVETTLRRIATAWSVNGVAAEPNCTACDAFPVGVYCTSYDGRIVYANEALVTLLGYAKKDAVLRLNVARDLYDDAGERRAWQDEIGRSGMLRDVVTAARTADGRRVYVRDQAIAMRATDATTCRYLGIWQRA